MQRITATILSITVAAVTVLFLATNGVIPTSLVLAQTVNNISPSYDGGHVTGHVTIVTKDATGKIVGYIQSDNTRTANGLTCSLMSIFYNYSAPNAGTCSVIKTVSTPSAGKNTGFNYIGLFNGSGSIVVNSTDTYATIIHAAKRGQSQVSDGLMINGSEGGIAGAESTAGIAGYNPTTPAQSTTVSFGAVTGVEPTIAQTITLTSPTYTFNNLGAGGTNIRGAALLNGNQAGASSASPQIFSEASFTGVSVGPQDTLQVTWTITLS